MTLVDLRRLAIRKQSKIRFALRNGMECVISEDGIARVPALKSVPEFNLEEELAVASAFVMDAASLSREALTAMAADSPAAVAVHEHDDE